MTTPLQGLIKKFFLRWDPKVAIVLADKVEEIELLGLAERLRSAVEDDLENPRMSKSTLQATCARVEDLVHLIGMKGAFPKDFTYEKWWNPNFEKVLLKKCLCGFRWQGRNNERDPKRDYTKREPFEPYRACTLPKGHKGLHKHDDSLGRKRTPSIDLPKRKKRCGVPASPSHVRSEQGQGVA